MDLDYIMKKFVNKENNLGCNDSYPTQLIRNEWDKSKKELIF